MFLSKKSTPGCFLLLPRAVGLGAALLLGDAFAFALAFGPGLAFVALLLAAAASPLAFLSLQVDLPMLQLPLSLQPWNLNFEDFG